MQLIKILPVGTLIPHFDQGEYRYLGWFTVIDGGYATHDVAKFNYNGKELYFSIEIVDKQFHIDKLLIDAMEQPFRELNKDMQQFVLNYFELSKGVRNET